MNACRHQPRWRPPAFGLTLVELMISMALGLLLMLVLIAIYINVKHSFNLQNNLARMQESARVAIGTLSREIQAAGFMGCANGHLLETNGTKVPIKGYASLAAYHADAGNPPIDATRFSEIRAPILVIRHGSNRTLAVGGAMAGGWASGDIPLAADPEGWAGTRPYLLITDCVGADRFRPTRITARAIAHPELSRAYGDDARLMAEQTSVFFVAVAPARSYASLYQHFTDGAVSQDLRLADHVERWSLHYGYGDEDGEVLGYTNEAGIRLRDDAWDSVKSVRVHLLLTSRVAVLDEPMTYMFEFVQAQPPVDRLLRKEFGITVALRNRLTATGR